LELPDSSKGQNIDDSNSMQKVATVNPAPLIHKTEINILSSAKLLIKQMSVIKMPV